MTGVTDSAPFYLPLGDEVETFTAAYRSRLPVVLKGPTGCGKTRFVEHMAWRLIARNNSNLAGNDTLVTVSCHEDLTATDLVGRYLLDHDSTVWRDGPLTRAVRNGAICYLDEIVEARKDTTVLIHSLTDHRRLLPIDKTGETLSAHDNFLLVISYNPGYQSILKDLKPSTRQRFVTLVFDYPQPEQESIIIERECGVDATTAQRLAFLGQKIRNLRDHGFEEGVSTRLLIYAGALIGEGVPVQRAVNTAIIQSLSDDPEIKSSLASISDVVFP